MSTGAKTILVSIHGPDRPGITTRLMSTLAGASLYDVEQVVVRRRLSLNLLIGVTAEETTVRDLLFFAWDNDLEIDFEIADPAPTPLKRLSVVTVIGGRIGPEEFGEVARAITAAGANIERILRLSRYPVVSYELTISDGDVESLTSDLVDYAAGSPIDVAIQPDGLARRAKRLVVMDVDSTLIQEEVIDLLAREAGVEDRVKTITAAAMSGDVDFERSLRERVALLQGLDQGALWRAASAVTLTPGARTLIRTLQRLGIKTAVVSAGFTRFTTGLAERLGIDYSLSNTLEVKEGRLTGGLVGEIVDAARKARFVEEIAAQERIPLDQVVAIGDGANDLEMLKVAGLGIAFNAKPVVTAHADTAISVPFLDSILFLLGIQREHVEAADAFDVGFDQPVLLPVADLPPV